MYGRHWRARAGAARQRRRLGGAARLAPMCRCPAHRPPARRSIACRRTGRRPTSGPACPTIRWRPSARADSRTSPRRAAAMPARWGGRSARGPSCGCRTRSRGWSSGRRTRARAGRGRARPFAADPRARLAGAGRAVGDGGGAACGPRRGGRDRGGAPRARLHGHAAAGGARACRRHDVRAGAHGRARRPRGVERRALPLARLAPSQRARRTRYQGAWRPALAAGADARAARAAGAVDRRGLAR